MSTILSYSTVKTRTGHRCWGCGRQMPAGTTMEVTSGVNDGHWFRSYWCATCVAVMATWGPMDLEEIDLRDVIENDPAAWDEARRQQETTP